MKLAVITPYYKESTDKLRRCHSSVVDQSVQADHFLIADGQANRKLDSWNATHVKLPVGMNDSGDTPRLIGLSMAATLGYDGFLFLDADNWFEPGHIEQMVWGYEQTGVPVVTCPRILRRLDGSVLGNCIESDGDSFNDFNCYLFMRAALPYLRILALPNGEMNYFTDRILWAHLRENCPQIARVSIPTVNYETTRILHYVQAGEAPPPEARTTVFDRDTGRCITMTADEYDAIQRDPSKLFGTVEEFIQASGNSAAAVNGAIGQKIKT
jgi:glycosyltransferase involved in cell wall biosynthesis